jgi:hypothetical protein
MAACTATACRATKRFAQRLVRVARPPGAGWRLRFLETGLTQSWCAARREELTQAQRAELQRQFERMRQSREAEQLAVHDQACAARRSCGRWPGWQTMHTPTCSASGFGALACAS